MDDGQEQLCPVAMAAEILSRRWTPLVVRALIDGSHRFNDIRRAVPRISPSLLTRRLHELEEAGVVARRLSGGGRPEYRLTAAGTELGPIIVEMGAWGRRWAQRKVSGERLDAGVLMWDVRRRIRPDLVRARPVVIHFHFDGAPVETSDFWLVLDGQDVDLCLTDPGHPVDLDVRADLLGFTQVWLGDIHYADALRDGRIRVRGPERLRRAFPGWLGLSLFASVEPGADARPRRRSDLG